MTLFLQRVYPAPDESGPLPVVADAPPEPGEAWEGAEYLAAGLTIYLPGEEFDPAEALRNPSPYSARFRPMNQEEDISVEEAQRMIRQALAMLMRGLHLRIAPGRTWRLLRNAALAAELGSPLEAGTILIEERLADPEKPFPDALYRLSRLNENRFLLDLIERWEMSGPEGFASRDDDAGGDEGEDGPSFGLGDWTGG